MKKIFLTILYILASIKCYSQAQSQNQGIIKPVPTAAALTTYSNIPVSLQTGVPDISYPLLSVPTNSKFVNVGLGLNYHTGNTTDESWISDVGKGWSLLGTSVISREIVGDFDESFDDETFHSYRKNEFDDVFNFSTPEESGKFRILRDTINNTFQVIRLTPYTSKVEYQRNSNMATLIADSFTVTSNTGMKYKFQEYDISRMTVWSWTHPWQGHKYVDDKKYRSAYYLTSILNENDQEIVKYIYLKDIKQHPGMPLPETIANRLTKIEIKDRAIIDINTSEMGSSNSLKNDKFVINDITLKTYDNRFVKKYRLDFSYSPPNYFRQLDYLVQLDSDGHEIEKYEFVYSEVTNGEVTGNNMATVLLKKVYLPTGGTIDYEFEIAPYIYDNVTVTIPAPTENFGNTSFSNVNTGVKKYFFTVNVTRPVTIDANGIGNLSNYSWGLQFFKKVGNSFQITSHSMGAPLGPDPTILLTKTMTFDPGEYYVEIYSNDFPVDMYDPAIFSATIQVGEPTESVVLKPIYAPARIKSIKHFNSRYAFNMSQTPVKSENYQYLKFSNPSVSNLVITHEGILYENVKVSQGSGSGYTKFYFKTPYSYPQTNSHWPYYNLTRGGLIEKKEIYNSIDQKVTEDIFDYTMQDFDAPLYPLIPNGMLVKTAWFKEEKVTSKNYFNSAVTETSSEIIRNTVNFQTSIQRVISYDGSVQETVTKYPHDKNNQKLINANLTGIPLETTVTKKKNLSDAGKIISKTETRFENAGHNYPSSSVSYDSQSNLPITDVTYDKYDSNGNLLQYKTKEGISVAIVWGYNNTQPIAKVEGSAYDQLLPYISDMINKSNNDINAATEQLFINALDVFRNQAALQHNQISTYVYDPLIGMKSSTPPSGIREFYKYDNVGRLEKIEDENGKLLKKYKYNYKQ